MEYYGQIWKIWNLWSCFSFLSRFNFIFSIFKSQTKRKWKAFCGCAGIFNSPVAIESYLTVFEEENALDNFEKFASLNGPNFYNVPPNKEKLKLVSRPNKIKDYIDVVEEKNIVGQIKPFHAGETLQWQVEGIVN